MACPARTCPLAAFPALALSLLTFVILFPPAASAMESVDFPQAVARALSNNALVSVSAAEAAAARKDASAALGYLLPSVRFEEKFVRTTVPAEAFGLKMNQEKLLASDFLDVRNFNSPPPRNDFIAAFSAEQLLFSPKAYLGYGMAKKEADAKGLDLYRRKEDAVYRVLTAYLDVITARQYVEVAGQGLSDAREHLRIAESLEAAGMGLASDVLRVKVAVAAAESGKVTAENRLELARRGLALAMGEPGAPPVDVTGPPPEFPDPGRSKGRGTRRPDGRTFAPSRCGSRMPGARSGSASRGISPRWASRRRTRWTARTIPSPRQPIVESGRGAHVEYLRRDAARGGAGKGRSGAPQGAGVLPGMRDQAAFEAAQADLNVKEATLREEIARASLASAEEGVRLLKSRYENHLGRMVDLLDAQTALDGARAARIRAENDARLSRAQRWYAAGGLLSIAAPSEENGKEMIR